MSLTFNAEAHEYRWDDKVVPHVTGILSPLNDFTGIPERVLTHARDRGIEIHKATEAIDRGQDVVYTEESSGYVYAYKQFLERTGFEATLVETPMYSEKHGYAGTIDRLGSFRQRRTPHEPRNQGLGKEVIIDIKTGSTLSPSCGPQMAAYELLVMQNYGYKCVRRFVLHLKDDGTFNLVQYRDSFDRMVFLSCLNIWRFQHESE